MLEAGYFFFLIIKKGLYLSFVGLAEKKKEKKGRQLRQQKNHATTPSTTNSE